MPVVTAQNDWMLTGYHNRVSHVLVEVDEAYHAMTVESIRISQPATETTKY